MNRLKQARQEKSIRDKKNISQAMVADEIGISQQAYARYEKGDREPKINGWQKLADYFGVSVGYLQGVEDDLGLAYDTAVEFKNYMYEEFYNDSEMKDIVDFYYFTDKYISELASSLQKLSLSETQSIYKVLSDMFDETLNTDFDSLDDKDKELYSKIENLFSLYFSRIEALKNIEFIENPNHIFAYTNAQLAKRDDTSINEDDDYTITYRNIYDLVYYLHLVQDNLSLVNLDKVDNAVNALKDLISSSDIIISDDLKKFIDAYKSNQ